MFTSYWAFIGYESLTFNPVHTIRSDANNGVILLVTSNITKDVSVVTTPSLLLNNKVAGSCITTTKTDATVGPLIEALNPWLIAPRWCSIVIVKV